MIPKYTLTLAEARSALALESFCVVSPANRPAQYYKVFAPYIWVEKLLLKTYLVGWSIVTTEAEALTILKERK